MSTCEAKIHAVVMAVKNIAHVKRLLKDLELIQDDRPLGIAGDNTAFIAQANSGLKYLWNAKHYEVRLRSLQQKVVDKEVESSTVLLIISLLTYLPNLWMNQRYFGLENH